MMKYTLTTRLYALLLILVLTGCGLRLHSALACTDLRVEETTPTREVCSRCYSGFIITYCHDETYG